LVGGAGVTGDADSTYERRLLDSQPGVREFVQALPEFVQWRARLAKVDVDGEEFAVVGGDRLMDDDQLVVEWSRRFRPSLLKEEE
jgi:hypothetical protein